MGSTQDQHSFYTSNTRQSFVRYFSVLSKSCLSQIPGVPLHIHFEGPPDRPCRSTQVFFKHAQIKFGPDTRNPLATCTSYLCRSVWPYMSTFKIFQALLQGHGDNANATFGHSHMLPAATSCYQGCCSVLQVPQSDCSIPCSTQCFTCAKPGLP